MKYCSNCGKELEENSTFCSSCGNRVDGANVAQQQVYNNYAQSAHSVSTPQKTQAPIEVESSGLSIAALVFSILGGGIGLILSIIGVCTSKVEANKNRSKAALIISIVWIAIYVIIVIVILTIGINAMNNASDYYYYY